MKRWILALMLIAATLAAADNNARSIRFKQFKGIWVGPQDVQSFTNNGPITILDDDPASPYPSSLTVSSVTKTIAHITVVIDGLSHSFPDDVDMLLVNPQGTNIVLMSDCGGNTANKLTNVVIRFTDTATNDLPDTTLIAPGTYKPTNYGAGDAFSAPAPTSGLATTFAPFLGLSPNGVWSLYIMDDQLGDAGEVVTRFYIIFEYNP